MMDSESSNSSTKAEESGKRRWKNGKEDSMTDVSQDDSHVDADVQSSYRIKVACLLMHLFVFLC